MENCLGLYGSTSSGLLNGFPLPPVTSSASSDTLLSHIFLQCMRNRLLAMELISQKRSAEGKRDWVYSGGL